MDKNDGKESNIMKIRQLCKKIFFIRKLLEVLCIVYLLETTNQSCTPVLYVAQEKCSEVLLLSLSLFYQLQSYYSLISKNDNLDNYTIQELYLFS